MLLSKEKDGEASLAAIEMLAVKEGKPTAGKPWMKALYRLLPMKKPKNPAEYLRCPVLEVSGMLIPIWEIPTLRCPFRDFEAFFNEPDGLSTTTTYPPLAPGWEYRQYAYPDNNYGNGLFPLLLN